MSTTLPEDIVPDNDQTRARRAHLEEIRDLVGNAYPNKFNRSNLTGSVEGEDTVSALADDETIKKIVGDEAFAEAFTLLASKVKEGARPTAEELEPVNAKLAGLKPVKISGRLATPPRVMGKAAFVHLSDGKSRLQIYVRRQEAQAISNDSGQPVEEGESGWKLFQLLDHGDFVGVEGQLFVTKTGELSVHVRTIQFLSKALVPMPDKMHGISDPEVRQRRRYADLIASSLKVGTGEESEGEDARHELSTREVFERRSKLITAMRRHLDDHGYVEVETPMLSPIASGAAARPFVTHHNALDIDLYLRIAPELYLKRLVVGGFERVYELNRNFRNEGISTRHNPEFTMLEFYTAYKDVNWMMDFCEEMVRQSTITTIGSSIVRFGEVEFNFGAKFQRLTMKEAIWHHWLLRFQRIPQAMQVTEDWLDDPKRVSFLAYFLKRLNLKAIDEFIEAYYAKSQATGPYARAVELASIEDLRQQVAQAWHGAAEKKAENDANFKVSDDVNFGQDIVDIFEEIAEEKLIQPTFIYDFPKAISPLSKASPDDPAIAERFELYVAGMEVANGFSELNDPVEQLERFEDQARQRERGDEEAMQMDLDYVRALSYGMPPAAGIGIGIDRLTMLLTNRRSIRDVILFPHMRPARQASDEQPSESDEEKTASDS
jgi:lysyl-tRNA synthetase class 2